MRYPPICGKIRRNCCRCEGQKVKEHKDGRMGLWGRWIAELKGTFNAGWLICAAAATLGVLGLTHIPQKAVPRVLTDRFDKIEHIVAYGVMATLYMLALKSQPDSRIDERHGRRPGRWEVGGWWGLAVLIVLGLAAIGAVDEWTQPYVGRTCDFWDWTSDAVGIVGVGVIFAVGRCVKKCGVADARNPNA